MDELLFAIPGEPVPWSPTKHNRNSGNRFLPARQEAAIAHNVAFINQQLSRARPDTGTLIYPKGAPLWLNCEFYVKRPQAHYGTGRNAGTLKDWAPDRPTGKPDRSNLEKMVEDCLVLARVCPDDDQIVTGTSAKFYVDYGDQQRTVVRLGEVQSLGIAVRLVAA